MMFNAIKEKSHIITSIFAKKTSNNILHSFMINKTKNSLRINKIYLTLNS